MKALNTKYEKNLFSRGLVHIAGIDEAGRGPWAGPVVAGCVVYNDFADKLSLNDSKKISPSKREKIYEILVENFTWSVGVVDNKTIDEINILQATKQAMTKAVDSLDCCPDYLLIDALTVDNISIDQAGIVGGDAKIWSIAAASIIAKVWRDRLMLKYHSIYPHYGFDRHKGYGTSQHKEALLKYRPCPIHRFSFAPIKKLPIIK